MAIRRPYVAGSFYPGEPVELQEYCSSRLGRHSQSQSARAVILPHAGYVYSGKTACSTLSQTKVSNKILMIGPDHRGVGGDFSLFMSGEWETPLGRTAIDSSFTQKLLKECPLLLPDDWAHESEHSLEVLLPFLQFTSPSIRISPIIVGTLNPPLLKQAALEIGRVIADEDEKPFVVISTDMSHYESDAATRKKDAYALDAIKNLDEKALLDAAKKHNITMCGFGPVYMLLCMKQDLGIKKAKLIEYTTSAEASGDFNRVVGYAGFIFE